MWFIKVENDITLENVCTAIGMEPKAFPNPLHQNILNIVFVDPQAKDKSKSMVYTNITLNYDTVNFQLRNGIPYGELDKDLTGISLYVDEENYDLADQIMNSFDNYSYRAMMSKL